MNVTGFTTSGLHYKKNTKWLDDKCVLTLNKKEEEQEAYCRVRRKKRKRDYIFFAKQAGISTSSDV